MATLAVQVVSKEIDSVAMENGITEIHTKTVAELLVAENIEASLTKEHSLTDSGILSYKSNSNISNSSNEQEKNLSDGINNVQHEEEKLLERGSIETDKLFQEQNTQSDNNKCLDGDSNSSFSSTLKGIHCINKEDDNSQSSFSNSTSTSAIKASPLSNDNTIEENNLRSFNSPVKKSQESAFKNSQSVNTDLIEDNDSRSSAESSKSKSTVKISQTVTNKSEDENNSRFSFKSSSNRSSPVKQSQEGSFIKSQSVNTDLTEDNDSCLSIESSRSNSTIKTSQPVADKSDDERNTRPKSASKQNTPEKQDENKKSTKKKYFSIIDSDSEDDQIVSQTFRNNTKLFKPANQSKLKNKRQLIHSDSDDDSMKVDEISKENKSSNEKDDSDSENENAKRTKKSNKISNIVDSESESGSENKSEAEDQPILGDVNSTEKTKGKKKTSEKKRTGSARASKDAAMQQIHSETQRLIRESEISLPYHRPKQRTLQEFLNRKKITSNIPGNLTCAEKVKMFPEVISKVVKEKEKEAEIFYKSSDSEDEKVDEPMDVDQNDLKKNKTDIQNEYEVDSSDMNISNTQKLTQDDIQESHNKRAILQQRSMDFGVPRKLFIGDTNDTEETENTEIYHNEMENLDPDEAATLKRKNKEVKTGLRESSIPRRLIMEDMEMDVDTNDMELLISEDKVEESLKEMENLKETELSENKTACENSTEDIILNLSDTELDSTKANKIIDPNKVSDQVNEDKDQESIKISETPCISNKELLKSHRTSIVPPEDTAVIENESSGIQKVNESEDLILELASDEKDKNEVIDNSVLRDDFGLPPDLDDEVKRPSLKEQMFAKAMKIKPVLKGSPGSVIDLTHAGPMTEGANRLLERFMRHTMKKTPNTEEVAEVKNVKTNGNGDDIKIIEEIMPFKKPIIEDGKKECIPGEKLKKLREDLKRRITIARNDEWKQKEEEEKEDEEEEEKCKGDDFYEGLPDEEELLEDEESGESEPEEDDIPIIESRRTKCEFGDDEAEESENDGDEEVDVNKNEEDEEDEENEDDEDDEDEENNEGDDENEAGESEKEEDEEPQPSKPKTLKRIIRPFEDDSNQSQSSRSSIEANAKLSFERTKTDEDMFASQASNGSETDGIPPFQPRDRLDSDSRSQACKTPLLKPNNLLSMISPVAQLTALNTSLDSAKKSASKNNPFSLGPIEDSISVDNTPLENSRSQSNCNFEKMIGLQKKLFEDPTEVNDDDLLAICSGKFITQNSQIPVQSNPQNNEVTDSQILELCSGPFLTQINDERKLEAADKTVQVADETSQDITLTLDEDDENRGHSPAKNASSVKRSDESMFSSDSKSPVKMPTFFNSCFKNPMDVWLKKDNENLDSQTQQKPDEVTDSQLLDICSGSFSTQAVDAKKLADEAHVQNETSQDFKLTFDENSNSPIKEVVKSKTHARSKEAELSAAQKNSAEEEPNVPWTGFTIVSSDDEEAKNKQSKKTKKLKKRKVQKLKLSDDEDDEPKEFSTEEESEIEMEEEEEQLVDYDSEENEVIMVSKKDIKKVATKFLEAEAELSESEWESDDEDEQDLDKLEYEEGDAEDIDENKMKDQLDKIRMKQVMDEDQRDVRLLQELLFDDGDLHTEGAGRERKFKWKNIDSIGEDEVEHKADENDEGIDDEVDTTAELEIRKMRYEQQKFLEEKEKSINKEIDEDFGGSKLLKLGLKVVSVRSSSKTLIEEQKINKANSTGNMINGLSNLSKTTTSKTKSLSFTGMRGSFLARGEETLVRIAQKLPETKPMSLQPGRNRKFVFAHLSPSVSNEVKDDSEHDSDHTPVKQKNDKTRKRKMFSSQSSQTPRTTKKLKVDDRTAGKKLF